MILFWNQMPLQRAEKRNFRAKQNNKNKGFPSDVI